MSQQDEAAPSSEPKKLKIVFVCGHTRPTRARYGEEEIDRQDYWAGREAHCDACGRQRLVKRLDLPESAAGEYFPKAQFAS
jgi:hypothetical protein